jgi:hypothetical protein
VQLQDLAERQDVHGDLARQGGVVDGEYLVLAG